MAKMDCTNLFRVYRALTAWFTLLTGILHVSLGSWYTSRGWSALDMSTNQTIDFTTRGEIVVIATGVGLVICSVALLSGAWFREGKVSFGLRLGGCSITLILLAFEILTAWNIFVNRSRPFETRAYNNAWNSTLSTHPERICELEQRLSCRGFLDVKCVTEACATCVDISHPFREACFNVMKRHLATSYLPVSITSTILFIIVLFDLVLACLLR